jgi:hypothetical protein
VTKALVRTVAKSNGSTHKLRERQAEAKPMYASPRAAPVLAPGSESVPFDRFRRLWFRQVPRRYRFDYHISGDLQLRKQDAQLVFRTINQDTATPLGMTRWDKGRVTLPNMCTTSRTEQRAGTEAIGVAAKTTEIPDLTERDQRQDEIVPSQAPYLAQVLQCKDRALVKALAGVHEHMIDLAIGVVIAWREVSVIMASPHLPARQPAREHRVTIAVAHQRDTEALADRECFGQPR